jgi:hypothetical protein
MVGTPLETAARIDSYVCGPWRCSLKQAVLLRPSGDAYDGGLELAGDFVDISELSQLNGLFREGTPFGLSYLARDVHANFDVYFFDVAHDRFGISIDVESSLVWYGNSEFTPGRWFEGFVLAIVNALRPEVVGYGRDAALPTSHESLDVSIVLKRLRDGQLISLPHPIFYAISTKVISVEEVAEIRRRYVGSPRIEYKLAPGYHLFMDVAQPK